MNLNRRFLLSRRPIGTPRPDDFSLVQTPIPQAADGSFVVRNRYASLDPAQRGWMDDAPSYMPPIKLGDPVRATTVGQVHSSANPSYFLSGMGAVGLTGYFGLIEVGKPRRGETVLVSGAAGAVGSAVGQIAKIKECRTIGIAGGPVKCKRLISDYHFDVAIDYHGKSVTALSAEIATVAPGGVDIVFENVGGDILDAALMNLAPKARVILCGLICEYNCAEGKIGARNIWQLIVKQATMHGFLIMDYVPRFAEGGAQIARWIGEGRMRIDEDIVEGIENTYSAFMKLFSGGNQGKLILKIA